MIKLANRLLKIMSSSHIERFRRFKTCFDVNLLLIVYPEATQVMFTTLYARLICLVIFVYFCWLLMAEVDGYKAKSSIKAIERNFYIGMLLLSTC